MKATTLVCCVSQAQRERRWFEDEGLGAEVAAGRATTRALINRIGTAYSEYVFKTFLPMTVGRLGQESLRCASRQVEMGLPPSPGNLQDGSVLDRLRTAAITRSHKLIGKCFDEATREYDTDALARLQTLLYEAVPTETTTGVREVAATLERIRAATAAACGVMEQSVGQSWRAKYTTALNDNALPFRLQRFPTFRDQLARYCAQEAPHLSDATLPSVLGFLDRALTVESSHVTLVHTLSADAIGVTIRLASEQIVGAIIHYFAVGFVVPTADQLARGLRRVVATTFSNGRQEQEAGYAERDMLVARQHRVDTTARQLLQLVDPSVSTECDGPLANTVRQVLPNLPDAAFSVELRQCVANGAGLKSPVYGGQNNAFVIVSRRGDGTQLSGGGLPFTAVVWRTAGGGTPLPVKITDNADGMYTGSYTVPLEEVNAAIAATPGDAGRPKLTAEFACCVTLYGLPVPGSPFHVNVHAVDPKWFKVSAVEPAVVGAGTPVTYTVGLSRVSWSRRPQLAPRAVRFTAGLYSLDGRGRLAAQQAEARVVGNADGSYTVQCTTPAVNAATKYGVAVCLGETHIRGSPAAVTVVPGRVLTYQSDFDTNGVLYHIGTTGGTEVYQNPLNRGVVATASAGGGRRGASNILNHQYNGGYAQASCIYGQNNIMWFSIDLGANRRLTPTYYTLRGLYARNWKLEGSHDGTSWTTLREHKNDVSFTDQYGNWQQNGTTHTASWPLEPTHGSFRYIRISSNDTSWGQMSCYGFEFYGFLEEQ
eukprot:m.42515 g.42515  ORF g.42515 m.42515 type:complete len:767 (-) comp6286_c0_seq1:71-2371(-)